MVVVKKELFGSMPSASRKLPRGKLKQSKQNTLCSMQNLCNPWPQDAVNSKIYAAPMGAELNELMDEKVHFGLLKVLLLVWVDRKEQIAGTEILVLSLGCV